MADAGIGSSHSREATDGKRQRWFQYSELDLVSVLWGSPDEVDTNVVALTIVLVIAQSLIWAGHSNPPQRKRRTRHRSECAKREFGIHAHAIAIGDRRRRNHGVPLVRCR